jgi:TPR repeat protein
MYQEGHGTAVDVEKAFHWHKRAAELGDSEAAYAVGNCLENGEGAPRDEKQALQWYENAAEKGSAWAHRALARAYRFGGLGRGIDCEKAEQHDKEFLEILRIRLAKRSAHGHLPERQDEIK